jgi:hypothetical protein
MTSIHTIMDMGKGELTVAGEMGGAQTASYSL